MKIRKATIDDMEPLIKLRIDYLLEENKLKNINDLESLKLKLHEYFNKQLPNNGFVAFFAEENNKIYSTAFLSIVERPPRKATSSYLVGTVYNVFTYPIYRKKGIATKVMSALLEEAKSLNVASIDLLATDAGQSLYERMGFQQITNYTSMRYN